MAKHTVIEDPVINSPFEVPKHHFKFDDDGITNEIIQGRRSSSYFMPIPRSKKKGKQLELNTEWTADRIEENKFINRIRERVNRWRLGHYQGVTNTTRRLLEYWTNQERDRKLFFCQIEALETAIYLTEVARKEGDSWIENDLRSFNQDANPLLFRLAFKMATGSGKTVVMAMLIAYHALNKAASPQDSRFSDSFLIVAPGITIRDRLRVLLPNDSENYYRQRDIIPYDLIGGLQKAKIIITNYHAFLPRERIKASKLTKIISGQEQTGANKESPGQVVRRVCREFGSSKRNIIVLNDEAHHCYRRKVDGEEEKMNREDKQEAKKREEEARVWISGLEAVQKKIGVKTVYDLSATPFFLKGSGYKEGTLFPWVVSDFALIDAIESGIVKVPRVPVADNTGIGENPTYRDLWIHIREGLPKMGRSTQSVAGQEPKLPDKLEGALNSLYGHYRKTYETWENNKEARERGMTPPVFIVVCNNTNVSKLVYDYVAGWEKTISEEETLIVPGKLDVFNNEKNGKWNPRPATILVDSTQLESGDAMSDDFKKMAVAEIEIFKEELRERFPGRNVEELTDSDLLREVMNTVGKQGKLGEHVKCVVSVSMLTEGWDANTVTHILGVRAFGTQLLCEQVVGRGLRRMSYAPETKSLSVNGKHEKITTFATEYAEVYGVPFSFIPTAGSGTKIKPGPTPTRVRALEERTACKISFPRVEGYRYRFPEERLKAKFTEHSHLALSTADIPTKTENAPIVGESAIMTLDDLKQRRLNEVAFLLAKLVLEKYFRVDGTQDKEKHEKHIFISEVQAWRFPEVLEITRRWLQNCVHCKDDTFPQLLLLTELAHDAAQLIFAGMARTLEGEKTLLPILRPYEPEGSTRFVDFDTTRPTWKTDPEKCHISHVVADTESWEQKIAQTLEEMPEVIHYVKNHGLGFAIPYSLNGESKNYIPDFIIRLDDGHGVENPLYLLLEVTGEKKKDKARKVETARTLWVPAINNDGRFGRWSFLEVTDPWDAAAAIRAHVTDDPLLKLKAGG